MREAVTPRPPDKTLHTSRRLAFGFGLSRRLFGAVRPHHVIVGAAVGELRRSVPAALPAVVWRPAGQSAPRLILPAAYNIRFCGAGLLGPLALLFTAVELRAQLVTDGATNTLANFGL